MFVTTYTMKLLFNLFVLLTGSNTKLAISGKWLHWLLLLRTKQIKATSGIVIDQIIHNYAIVL